jgi:hypothetical protein
MAHVARLRGFKAALTTRINVATAQYDAVQGLHHPTARQLEDLVTASNRVQEQFDRLQEFCIERITAAADDAEADPWQTELNQAETRANTATARIITLVGDFNAPPPAAAAPAAAAGAAPQRCRPNDALKPERLTPEHSPVDYRVWRGRFDAYYSSSNMRVAEVADQRAYLFNCLDITLEKRIKPFCLAHTPVYDDGLVRGCLSRLDDEFNDIHPVLVRRLDFMKESQKAKQPFAEFYAALCAQGDEADLPTMNPEDLYVMRLIAGAHDPKLREKFLREANPTREILLRVAREHERATVANKHIDAAESASHGINVQRATSSGGGGFRKSSNVDEFFRAHMAKLRSQGICTFCGMKNCAAKCNRKQLRCGFCKAGGHAIGACVKKAKAAAGVASGGSNSASATVASLPASQDSSPPPPTPPPPQGLANAVATVQINALYQCNPTPRVRLYLEDLDTHRAINVSCIPDTGATMSVISEDLVATFGFTRRPGDKHRLRAANGNYMTCTGTVGVRLRLGEADVNTQMLITDAFTQDVFIGWQDLQRLGIIPRAFPAPIEASVASMAAFPSDPEPLLKSLKAEFPDVFNDQLIRPMKGKPMTIHLQENYVPTKCLTARQTPIHLAEDAADLLGKSLASGVIVPTTVPTEWISPAFFVPKPNGRGARMVCDFTALNKYVKRPVHPFPSPLQLFQRIGPDAKFFAVFDAVQGYHQIPLDHASSLLTTFILPEGRFRYTRAPMGLNASSDEWCARSDVALEGLTGVQKIVDDILVYAPTMQDLALRARAVLARCAQHGITLADTKAQLGTAVQFAGYAVGADGIKPDPDKVAAIDRFPAPKGLMELRSFLGLAVQLASFVPDLAHMSAPLRGLLRRDTAYNWLPEHQEAFDRIKQLLTSPLVCAFFAPGAPIRLLTDASRLRGIGYALQQQFDGVWKLIRCGSRFLTDPESRWATIELEALAIFYGITSCAHFLRGAPHFEVITDHRPLPHAFRKTLSDVENVRIARMREKLTPFNFSVVWCQGKQHMAADALSRNPVFDAPEDTVVCDVNICLVFDDPLLDSFKEQAVEDPDYAAIAQAVRRGQDVRSDSPTAAYRGVWDRLSVDDRGLVVLDGHRLVVPVALRPKILQLMHRGHCGIVKSQKLAKSLYFWPGMPSDIKNLVEACEACQTLRPSLHTDIVLSPPPADEPFDQVGTDLFEFAGNDYIVLVDQYSGFPLVAKLPNIRSETVIRALDSWFLEFGYPRRIISDHGRQFLEGFDEWCQTHGIIHKPLMSSPHNHRANGLAEAAVKQVKHLLKKADGWSDFNVRLLYYRTTPRAVGDKSPAELFFKRQLRTDLPAWSPPPPDVDEGNEIGDGVDSHVDRLPPLKIGERVRLQNPLSKLWDDTAVVVATRDAGRSYFVSKDSDGRQLLRNRRFLKPLPPSAFPSDPPDSEPDATPPPTANPTTSQASALPPPPTQLDHGLPVGSDPGTSRPTDPLPLPPTRHGRRRLQAPADTGPGPITRSRARRGER